MRVRIAPQEQAKDLARFLKEQNYPHEWTEEMLAKHALMVRVEKPDEIIGWVWFTWVPHEIMVLDIHLCVRPEWRGRWLSRKTLFDLKKVAEFVNAKGLLARTDNPTFVDALLRMGFCPEPDGAFLKLDN